jgi:hypothetical protein
MVPGSISAANHVERELALNLKHTNALKEWKHALEEESDFEKGDTVRS